MTQLGSGWMLRVSFFTSTTNVDSNMPRKFPTHRQRTHYSRDLKRCVIYQSEILNMKNTPIAINLNMPLRVVEQVKQTFDRVPVGLDHIVVPVVLTCYFLCINCWVVCLGQGFSGARRFARMDIMVWLGGFQYNSRPCRRIRRFMNKCGGGGLGGSLSFVLLVIWRRKVVLLAEIASQCFTTQVSYATFAIWPKFLHHSLAMISAVPTYIFS